MKTTKTTLTTNLIEISRGEYRALIDALERCGLLSDEDKPE